MGYVDRYEGRIRIFLYRHVYGTKNNAVFLPIFAQFPRINTMIFGEYFRNERKGEKVLKGICHQSINLTYTTSR